MLTAICWSLTGIFIVFLADLSPLTIVWARASIAAVTLIPFILFLPNKNALHATRKTSGLNTKGAHAVAPKKSWRRFAPFGLSALMSFYYLCSSFAFLNIPVAMVAMIIALSPVVILIIKAWQRHPIGFWQAFGILISVLATCWFILKGASNSVTELSTASANDIQKTPMQWLTGITLASLSTLSLAIFSISSWRLTNTKEADNAKSGTSPYASTFNTCLILAILLAPAVQLSELAALNLFQWTQLILLGVTATAMATAFNAMASKRVPPQIHATFCMATPLIAAILADLWLDQNLTLHQYAALALCLTGICITVNATINEKGTVKVHSARRTPSQRHKKGQGFL